MQTSFQNILYEKRERVAYFTINRPERLNAIDTLTNEELLESWADFRIDDEMLVAIVTGAGDRAFSTGADLIEVAEGRMGPDGSLIEEDLLTLGVITRNFHCDKPIIAAINGYCVGGGLEIALACDIRIASESAQFGLPEPLRAIMPAAGGTQRLPKLVPMALAMEMLLTGRTIDTQTAP